LPLEVLIEMRSVAGYLVATQTDPKWEGKKARNVEIKKTKMGNKEEIIFLR